MFDLCAPLGPICPFWLHEWNFWNQFPLALLPRQVWLLTPFFKPSCVVCEQKWSASFELATSSTIRVFMGLVWKRVPWSGLSTASNFFFSTSIVASTEKQLVTSKPCRALGLAFDTMSEWIHTVMFPRDEATAFWYPHPALPVALSIVEIGCSLDIVLEEIVGVPGCLISGGDFDFNEM